MLLDQKVERILETEQKCFKQFLFGKVKYECSEQIEIVKLQVLSAIQTNIFAQIVSIFLFCRQKIDKRHFEAKPNLKLLLS